MERWNKSLYIYRLFFLKLGLNSYFYKVRKKNFEEEYIGFYI